MQSTSMLKPRRGAHSRCAAPSRRANTSIAKSPSLSHLRRRWRWRNSRAIAAYGTASCRTNCFCRIFSVRGEFGYYVFEGDLQPAQRPSWNYRKEDGGGIVMDMLSHWRYLLDHTFGPVRRVSCHCATHIPRRWDEDGKPYDCTAEDTAYATFELENGILAHLNSSWCVRVYRDELLQLQVDGTHASAIAGLRECRTQHRANTPKAVWNPDIPNPIDFFGGWQPVPENQSFDNAFKAQWEMFLRHAAIGEPFKHDLFEGAKGVQLGELALQSWREGRWMDVPPVETNPAQT